MYGSAVKPGAEESGGALGNVSYLFWFEISFIVIGVYFCHLHVNDELVVSVGAVCVCVTGDVVVEDFCHDLTNKEVLSECTNSFLGCIFS